MTLCINLAQASFDACAARLQHVQQAAQALAEEHRKTDLSECQASELSRVQR